MNGETWKPETGLRWRRTPNLGERILEQIWICIETGRTEWRPVPEEWVEVTSDSAPTPEAGKNDESVPKKT